uniref:Telomerase RNA component interacting RNase n=1 Tax=Astyanax mexicanus TaxID=7994 RepID=A0A3B1JQK3_ASTMX
MEAKRSRAKTKPPSSGSSDSSGGPASPASPAAPPAAAGNAFANDGSFMELFKKKMEEEERRKRELQEEEESKSEQISAVAGQSSLSKKTLNPAASFAEAGKGDAWSKYMAEVKKYKAHQCGDDDKTRPLVK